MRKNLRKWIILSNIPEVKDKRHTTIVETIQSDGFGIVKGVLSEPEANVLREDLSCRELPRSRAGIRHVMAYCGVSEFAHDPEVLRIVKSILGDSAIPFRATLFDKSPTSNWLVMWHQDTALPLTERSESEGWGPWSIKDGVTYAHAPREALDEVLAVRLHLDDSSLENGPLRILPGTHRAGVLTDGEIERSSENVKAVDCPVPIGGVLLMRPLVIHASSKSTCSRPRRVLHIEYASHREIAPGKILAIA